MGTGNGSWTHGGAFGLRQGSSYYSFEFSKSPNGLMTDQSNRTTEYGLRSRLAAILSCDVSAYTRMTEADEIGSHQAWMTCRDIVTDIIRHHEGRIVNYTGDGALVEFASALAAVRCAVSIQYDLSRWNLEREDEEPILVRLGINLGEVIVEGNEIYGDGVNVAVRLQGFAKPGGVCVSSSVYEFVKGQTDVVFYDLGMHKLKNIQRPTRIYEIELDVRDSRWSSAATVSRGTDANPGVPTHLLIVEDDQDQQRELVELCLPETSY